MATKTIKPVTSMEAVIEALGSTRSNDPEFWLPEFIYRGHKCTINNRAAGGKYELSVSQMTGNRNANHYESNKMWNVAITSTRATNTRPAVDIAMEFDRRIEWDLIEVYNEKVVNEDREHVAHCNSTENIAQTLCLILNKGIDKHSDQSYTVKDNGPWHSNGNGGTGSVYVSGDYVDFAIKGVSNIELAKELCQVMAKYQRS